MRGILTAMLCVFAIGLSTCKDVAREEARAFLEGYHAIDIGAEPAKRRSQVAALRALELQQHMVKDAANKCLEAHNALLVAEEEQAQAQHALKSATEGPGSHYFDADKAAKLSNMIRRSNENVVRARKLFPSCERAVRTLSLKYAKRR